MPLHLGGERRGYSIIIPTLGRPESLRGVLAQLAEAVTLAFEVVIVYDGGDPGTYEELSGLLGLLPTGAGRLIMLGSHRGVAVARNAGVEASSLPFCIFLDDDVALSPTWWEAVKVHSADPRACFTGPVLTHQRSILARARAQRYDARYASLRTGEEVSFLAGGNAIVPRDPLVESGGFPLAKVGSDSLLIQRLAPFGICCRFSWEMSIYHVHDRGVVTAVRNAYQSGRSVPTWGAFLDEARRSLRLASKRDDPWVSLLNGFLLLFKAIGVVSRRRENP